MDSVKHLRRHRIAEPATTEAVHGSFIPADIREGEKVNVQLKFEEGCNVPTHKYRLWHLSPLGAEIAIDMDALPENYLGKRVDVTLEIAGQKCEFYGLVICSVKEAQKRVLVGFRWCNQMPKIVPIHTRRAVQRWVCGTNFLPSGVAANPVQFNDLLYFRAIDFSRDGMRLHTSMRNKFIVPGMSLDCIFSFPMIGSARADLIVRWTDQSMENGKQVLSLGVQFRQPSVELLHAIGQYAIQFAPEATIEQVRESGLKVRHASRALTYSHIRTEEDYRDVLKLRAEAYSARFNKKPSDEDMADLYDTRSRIILARHQGRPVGTVRIIFHDPTDPLELERGTRLPEDFAKREELVEISKLCLHPEYRKSDLFCDLIKHTYIAMLQAKRRWLIATAPPDLIRSYQKVGCEILPISFPYWGDSSITLTVMRLDLYSALKGNNVNAAMWKLLYEDVSSFAERLGLVHLETKDRLRMASFRTIGPALKLLKLDQAL